MTFFTVAIPAYEAHGEGNIVLEHNFIQLEKQSFQDFDVVVTDHSPIKDYIIENLCYRWRNRLDINYFRNENDRGNPAANTNLSIEMATGEYIKLLCFDDYLLYEHSLQDIYDEIDEDFTWCATAYIHTWDREHLFNLHLPSVNPNLHVVNTIGTPSCVTIKNVPNLPKMDTNLYYHYDCDFYFRLLHFFGMPKYINTPNMVNFLWGNSITSSVTQELMKKEQEYIISKYQGKL